MLIMQQVADRLDEFSDYFRSILKCVGLCVDMQLVADRFSGYFDTVLNV